LASTLVCHFRGLLAYYQGDAEEAVELLEKSLALERKGTYKPDVAWKLIALARVMRIRDDIVQATELVLEGLDLFSKYGRKLGVAIALEELAAVKAVQGDSAQAVMLLSTAHALREGMGAPLPPVDRAAHDSVVAACRAQLGETAFAEAWAHAAARPFQEVVEEVSKRRPSA
jgi:tetratricopeptide (TPR) repeat protein